MKTATQLELATMTPADAFGPKGIAAIIAGHAVYVRRDGDRWQINDPDLGEKVIVTNDLAFVEINVARWFNGGAV